MALGGNQSHVDALTTAAAGSSTQIQPLAAAQAQTLPWPRVASRPPTSAFSHHLCLFKSACSTGHKQPCLSLPPFPHHMLAPHNDTCGSFYSPRAGDPRRACECPSPPSPNVTKQVSHTTFLRSYNLLLFPRTKLLLVADCLFVWEK